MPKPRKAIMKGVIMVKEATKKAMEELKKGFNVGFNREFDKVTEGKYREETDCMEKTKKAFSDATGNLELNGEKMIERSNTLVIVLGILSIADIIHYGFKEHTRRAYSNPVKQFLLGALIEIGVILSCIEKVDDTEEN